MLDDCLEIKRILISTLKTAKENKYKKPYALFCKVYGFVFSRCLQKEIYASDLILQAAEKRSFFMRRKKQIRFTDFQVNTLPQR